VSEDKPTYEGNGGDPAVDEAAMIRAMAEGLANRFHLDTSDGKLLDRPILCMVFMCEQLLNRVELLEEVLQIKQKAGQEIIT